MRHPKQKIMLTVTGQQDTLMAGIWLPVDYSNGSAFLTRRRIDELDFVLWCRYSV